MKQLFFIVLITISTYTIAQIPSGYYDAANGLTGTALKNKLHDIISVGYTSVSYSSLPTHYETTDVKSNGKVWDMYSDKPGQNPPYEFTFNQACGNYDSEADCWNREHSVPASWFNDNAPMYSDLFHVVPTDGYVNNRRSNYPFGKVGSATWTSQNGSKLGSCNFPGYTGTVFEPIDSFKGDFARIYFYMATRYKDEMPNWTSDMFTSGDLSTWAKNLLLQWHALDPVSYKEMLRNNRVYNIQHNRNPYVDHPEWVNTIWGTTTNISETTLSSAQIFPNPATDVISISLNKHFTTPLYVTIHDCCGRIILSNTFQKNDVTDDFTIPINSIENGVYFVTIKTNDAILISKFIKQNNQ